MSSPFRRAPRFDRQNCEPLPEPALPPSSPQDDRLRLAARVVARLADPGSRVAVINDHGRAALVNCREMLFDVLAKDHAIVGVYAPGAQINDVIEDLQAAGL
jgi:hypothetical protein